MTDTTPQISAADRPGEGEFRDYLALLKPRVMRLVVFTCIAAMLAAPTSVPLPVAIACLLCIAVGAGAAGALNMWWDADIDARMARTRQRPIPQGRVHPDAARDFGIGLAILSVVLLAAVGNPLSAGLLAFTIVFYAVVYSIWLKRRTPQNIVIGGLAGALPPAIAWAAVTGEIAAAPTLMVLTIFLWTPPHFWALALYRNADYARVGVPMLPVVAGETETRRQIWGYSIALAPAPVALAMTEAGGPVTLLAALLSMTAFLRGAWIVRRRDEAAAIADGYRSERRLFAVSIICLFAIFGALIGDRGLRALLPALDWPVWI